MPISSATPRDQNSGNGYVVSGPRKSDSISDALRAAFGRQEEAIDDFSVLLGRIDAADRALGNC